MSALRGLTRPASIEARSHDGWVVAALIAVVSLPIVAATVRALRQGWLAVGDNGNFLIRSRDVLTAHHPLLGTWSSASIPIGHDVNHPGPLLFDLLAFPSKVGGSGGLAIGVMLLHVACIALIGVFGWRAGGTRLAAGSLAAVAGLSWTMGSELLYDPWNPHVLLVPVLLLLVLTMGMACGDAVAVPVAVGVASVIVETHLSYVLLVPPLCFWGLVFFVRRVGVARALRPVLAAGVVALVCWAQPIADQVRGEGNLGTLVGSLGTRQDTVGPRLGLRIVAEVIALPPWWGRTSFGSDLTVPKGQAPLLGGRPNLGGLPSGGVALAGVGAIAGLLGAAFAMTRRRRDVEGRVAVGVATVAVLLAMVATVRLPIGGVGVPPHQVRYLWPVGAFVTTMAISILVPRRWAAASLATVAAVLAFATVPTYAVPAGPQADREAIPIVRQLSRRLDQLKSRGTLLYDTSHLRFAEPWTSALMATLQAHGIRFTVDDPVWVRQLGSRREDHGSATARFFVREGDAARSVPVGMRRVAFVEGLDPAETRELARLERSLVDLRVDLNRVGRAAVATGALPEFAAGAQRASALLSYGGLASLVYDGLVTVPPARARDLLRYAALRRRADRQTVALFLDPTPYR